MTTEHDPYVHIYHRIAENVNRAHKADVDATDVERIVTVGRKAGDASNKRDELDIAQLIWEEAEEYGIPVPGRGVVVR